MSNEEKPRKQPGEEDSWETLAEDLFGIDFGKAAARSEPPPDDEVSPVVTEDSSSVDSDEPTETDADEVIAADSEEDSAAVEEDLAAAESGEAASEPEKPGDDYWDALSDWDWDNKDFADDVPDAEGEIPSPPPRQSPPPSRRGSPAGSSQREATQRSTSAVAPREERSVSASRDDFVDDDGFGLGVLDEVEATPAPPEVGPSVPSTGTKEIVPLATGRPLSSTFPLTPARLSAPPQPISVSSESNANDVIGRSRV